MFFEWFVAHRLLPKLNLRFSASSIWKYYTNIRMNLQIIPELERFVFVCEQQISEMKAGVALGRNTTPILPVLLQHSAILIDISILPEAHPKGKKMKLYKSRQFWYNKNVSENI